MGLKKIFLIMVVKLKANYKFEMMNSSSQQSITNNVFPLLMRYPFSTPIQEAEDIPSVYDNRFQITEPDARIVGFRSLNRL